MALELAVSSTEVAAPSDELAVLHATAADHAARRRSANTLRAYESDWRQFQQWCAVHGLDSSVPVAPSTIVYFLTDQARTHKVSTVARRLGAIAYAHTDAGYATPTKYPDVVKLMDGLRRTQSTRPDHKSAIVTDELRSILRHTPSTLAGARDKALLALGFAGAFRRSELVSLNVEDLHETRRGMEIELRSSKTDQYGHGEKVAIPFAHKREDACPVRLLKAWIDAAGITHGPLFRQVTKGDELASGKRDDGRLSDRSVANIVKAAALRAGENPERLSGHSLRVGFITSASDGGAPTRTIMAQTRHKTAAMIDRYYRKEDLFTDNAMSYTGL